MGVYSTLFDAETEQGVALAILRGVIDFKREPWPQISESAKSLVRQMLEQDPKKRLTAQQVLGELFNIFPSRISEKVWIKYVVMSMLSMLHVNTLIEENKELHNVSLKVCTFYEDRNQFFALINKLLAFSI